MLYFNPIQPGKDGRGQGGGRVQSAPPPCTFKAIEATAKGLKGCKLCPKLFCLRVAKWTNKVLSCSYHNFILFFKVAILDFSISPKLQKAIQIGSKFNKNKTESTWRINGSGESKCTCRIFVKNVKKKNPNLELMVVEILWP